MRTSTNTAPFRQWRLKANLSQRQAAERLGLGKSMVDLLDRGAFAPKRDTRMLMWAVIEMPGKSLKAWEPGDV